MMVRHGIQRLAKNMWPGIMKNGIKELKLVKENNDSN
jgi:hypothetical protein